MRKKCMIGIALGGLLPSCGDGPSTPDPCAGIRLAQAREEAILDEAGNTLRLDLVDACDEPVAPRQVTWTSSNDRIATVSSGLVTAVSAGKADINARSEIQTVTVRVHVLESSTGGSFAIRGLALNEVSPSTGDFWLHGTRALVGSNGDQPQPVLLYDLTDPDAPALIQTVPTPTSSSQDVKIGADGSFAVVGMQADDGGIMVLDLTDGTAAVVATYREGLERGVHNLWIEEIGGTWYAFLAENGSSDGGGLHVIDLSQLDQPTEVAHYYGGTSSVHDVYVREGLAFVSHWDLGLVILDVGNGLAGGSPTAPVEVSRIFLDGETHNAWYWPAAATVFVGEEDFLQPTEQPEAVGRVHVVDVSDLASPVERAMFTLGGTAPHNFWMDEDEAILFVAWYEWGMRAIDVSGPLAGELADQGRELAAISPRGPTGGITNFFSPRLHGSRVYGVDTEHGMWVFDFTREP